MKGRLVEDPNFKCRRCLGNARPIDARAAVEFRLGDDVLDIVNDFCYLGDTICAGGGCERAIVTRVRCAWSKFRELLPLLTSRSISLKRRGHLFSSCVRSVLLHAAECWATTKNDMDRIRRTDRTMIRWMCNVRLEDRTSSTSLLTKLNLSPIETLVQGSRLRWYGHVARSLDWINKVTTMQVDGTSLRGRPKKTWRETVQNDMVRWGMDRIDPSDRNIWRRAIQSKKRVEPAGEVEQ